MIRLTVILLFALCEFSWAQSPLLPLLKEADAALTKVAAVRDYGGQLTIAERGQALRVVSFKVRHYPFAVYLHYDLPMAEQGQEALWRTEYGDRFHVHEAGRRSHFIAMDHPRVQAKSRYRVSQFGLYAMVQELRTIGRQEARWQDITVTEREEKVGDRPCRVTEITHTSYPQPRQLFWKATVSIDKEYGFPVAYGAWSRDAADKPVLLESYVFAKLRLNAGYTEADFSPNQPRYGFR